MQCVSITSLSLAMYFPPLILARDLHSFEMTMLCIQVKEGNARDGRSHLVFSLILPLYMSGEELIWEAAMMIF